MAGLAGLGGWFKKNLEATKNGLNPFDNVGWTANKPAQQPQPQAPIRVAAPQAPQYRNPQIQNAAMAVHQGRMSPDAFANYISGLGPAHERPNYTPQAVQYGVAGAKAAVKPYWETLDAAKQLVTKGPWNKDFQESGQQSIVGGVFRGGQKLASAALTPVLNNANKTAVGREQQALDNLVNNLVSRGVPADRARFFAEQGIGLDPAKINTDMSKEFLARSGDNIYDSNTRTFLKAAAALGEGAFDVATLGATGQAAKVGAKYGMKQAVLPYAKSGGLGAAGNTLYAAQQDNVNAGDLAKAGAAGFATGALLPVAINAGAKLVGSVAGSLVPQRPFKITDEEVAAIGAIRNKPAGGFIDDGTYKTAQQALDRLGLSFNEPGKVDDVLGKFRTYENRKAKSESGHGGGDLPIGDTGKLRPSPKKNSIPPEQKYYRGVTASEWNDLQNGGVSANKKTGRAFVGSLDDAEMAIDAHARSGKKGNVIIEYKDSARNKLVSGEDLGENVGGNLPGEYQAKGLGLADIAKVTDENGKVIYQDSVSPPKQAAPITIAAPEGKQSRFANVTVQNSDEVSAPLQKLVKEENVTYTPHTDEARLRAADEFVASKNTDDAFTEVLQSFEKNAQPDDQSIANGIALAKKLDEASDETSLFKATEIYDNMSRQLTEWGQGVQAASLISNRTPQGLMYSAQKTLRQNGVDLTPEVQRNLKQLVDNVKKAERGSYDDGLARYKLGEYVIKNVPAGAASKGVQLWKAGLLSAPTTTGGNLTANTAEQVFKHGYKDPVASGVDTIFSLFTGERSKSLTYRGIVSGAQEGLGKGVQYFKTGYDPRNPLEKFDIKSIHYSNTPLGRAAEVYTQSIFRLMGAQDQPFYYASFRNSLADQAITAAKNAGLKGEERATFVKKYVTEPSQKALQIADNEARYDVFQNPTALGNLAKRVNQGPVGQFLVPFSQVPSSVATRMIDRTPLGLAKEIVTQVKAGKFDQRAMSSAIADASAGVVIIGAGAALAKAGELTLGYPTDSVERDLWELEGKQPNSIKIGDTWVSLNYLQPLGTLMAAGANYQGAVGEGKDPIAAYSAAVAGAGKALTEQSFLKGVSGALNAVADPQRSAEKFAENTTGSLAPNFIRSAARSLDPVQREQDGLGEAFKASIPGLRQTLPEKTDIFGGVLPRKTDAANSFLNPLRPSNVRESTTLTSELRRLQNVDEGITATKIQADALGKDIKLDRDQKLALKNQIGQLLQQAWSDAVSDNRYTNLSDAEKNKVLDTIKRDITAAIKDQYGVSKGLREPDPGKLSRNVKIILGGGEVDYFSKPVKTTAQKKTTGVKTAKAKTVKTKGTKKGRGLPKISVSVSGSVKAPTLAKSRAPSVRLKGIGRIKIASNKKRSVKLNTPKKLSNRKAYA